MAWQKARQIMDTCARHGMSISRRGQEFWVVAVPPLTTSSYSTNLPNVLVTNVVSPNADCLCQVEASCVELLQIIWDGDVPLIAYEDFFE